MSLKLSGLVRCQDGTLEVNARIRSGDQFTLADLWTGDTAGQAWEGLRKFYISVYIECGSVISSK